MADLKGFRKQNNLRQIDLADYLGVSREFISMVESGKLQLPANQLRKLLDNNKGWDTATLEINHVVNGDHIEQNGGTGNIGKISGDSSAEIMALRKEIEFLRSQIEELKKEKDAYWALIQNLTNK